MYILMSSTPDTCQRDVPCGTSGLALPSAALPSELGKVRQRVVGEATGRFSCALGSAILGSLLGCHLISLATFSRQSALAIDMTALFQNL